ncbi:MAG TPA: carbohydrate ABC transporter permease [Limnochordia bacterium]|nr:carbohydrate ABC transporter permease [Limnochordia bacterium]
MTGEAPLRGSARPPGRTRRGPRPEAWWAQALSVLGALVIVGPFAWMLLSAFKTQHQIMVAGGIWPEPWVLTSFTQAWQAAPFARYFLNSAIVTGGTVALQLIVCALAAYAFARLAFFGRELLFLLFLATMMIPQEVNLIGDYLLMSRLGWLDTYWSLIVPWGASPLAIFLLRQTLRGLPDELADAARLDGCGNWGFLWRIALPLCKPALAAVAVLGAVGSWNDFTWPLIMTNSDAMRTVQVGVSIFSQDAGTQYPLLMAASTLVMLPVVAVFVALRGAFMQGVARSGLK